jgi:peroxiredoxin
MALVYSSASDLGAKAPPFSLPATDGVTYSLDSFRTHQALLVIFMCNHCPYVIAVYERLNRLAQEFGPKGLAVIGINSNDPAYKIDDSFENMKMVAQQWGLKFPYAFDETQNVAKNYDAVCTPDPYLYENVKGEFLLRYRGQIDDSWQDESKVKVQSLKLAIDAILNGKRLVGDQVPSMGCSIKWKELTASTLAAKAAAKMKEEESK